MTTWWEDRTKLLTGFQQMIWYVSHRLVSSLPRNNRSSRVSASAANINREQQLPSGGTLLTAGQGKDNQREGRLSPTRAPRKFSVRLS